MMKNYAQNWLDLQCQSIDGVCCALFLLIDDETKNLKPASQWPNDSKEPLELLAISQLAKGKLNNIVNASVISDPTAQPFDYLASPIMADKELLGVIAVKTLPHNAQEQQKILHTLTVGKKWLALPRTGQDEIFTTAVRLAVSCLDQESVTKAYTALIGAFSREFTCERVAIGIIKQGRAQIVALTNSAIFDAKSNLLRCLGAVMDEAMDQDSIVVYPPVEENDLLVGLAHDELARKFHNGAIVSIPLVFDSHIFAVMTMERSDKKPFDTRTLAICEQTLALVSPYLKLKQDDEMPLTQRLGTSLSKSIANLFGYQNISAKMLLLAAGFFCVLASLLEGDFRVHADAVLEGKIQRTVSAPMDGFIKSANVRAGDTVLSGDSIAVMEDTDLSLEKIKLLGQQKQLQRESQEAMAKRDLVKMSVLSSQITQVEAQIKLKSELLQRIRIPAPFDGIVIEGDLSQLLGSPVKRGESLFKIAPLDGYRVILKVNERDISYIRPTQSGILVLSSMPDRKLPFHVEKIMGAATLDEGYNIFRIEALLLDKPTLLRPGMKGVSKINIGKEKWLWIWTHELTEWLQLWLWSWWP